jgi:hypothetical protein
VAAQPVGSRVLLIHIELVTFGAVFIVVSFLLVFPPLLPVRASCSGPFILLDLFILIILSEVCKLQIRSINSFLRSTVPSSQNSFQHPLLKYPQSVFLP